MATYETRRKRWEELDITREELKNLTECLSTKEFRDLLAEYAKEVTDPENRKIYEKEITQLEKQRGNDVTFLNPEPGYVIKTSIDGDRKCFLNISQSDVVGKPSSQPSYEHGKRGLRWTLPHALVPPRIDFDKKNVRCVVCEAVFHPDTVTLASRNAEFRELVNASAMDSVETHLRVKLDRRNLKFPTMSYKGVPHLTVIRKQSRTEEAEKKPLFGELDIYEQLMASYDETRRQQQFNWTEEPATRPAPPTRYYKENGHYKNSEENNNYVTPKFSVKHQSDLELEDFEMNRNAKMNATVPKRLIVTVDLPLLKTASDVALVVQERSLSVKSKKPAKYLLDLPLPYSVDADLGNAKFDSKYKKLIVTLPVIPPVVTVPDTMQDNRVDSSQGSPVPLAECSADSSPGQNVESEAPAKLIEQCDTVTSTTNVGTESENLKDSPDTALRTGSDSLDEFLDPSVKHTLPAFVCNVYNNQLAVTVNVKNVDPSSIRHRTLQNNVGLHVSLTSIGAGFFPQYYSLCLKIHETTVDPGSLSIETWDNNVVFTVALKDADSLAHYYVGIDEEFMEKRDFATATASSWQKGQLKELTASEADNFDGVELVDVETDDDGIVIDVKPARSHSDDREHPGAKSTPERRVSESSGDELSCNHSTAGRLPRGILKCRRNHDFSRSVSESSTDENGVIASFVDCHYDSVHDVNSESDCSSLKKTVRFNDVVSRQLFRSNSSILGQRKKNQRKLKNKRRAHERRLSESENSETEERERYRANQKSAEAAEIVKPILNKDKQSEEKKPPANAETRKTTGDNNRSPSKGKSASPRNIPDTGDNVEHAVETVFKNDLIFDIDI